MKMKKRWVCFALLIAVLLSGCTPKEEAAGGITLDCYYLNKECTKLVSETIALSGDTMLDRINEVMQDMARIPDDAAKRPVLTNTFSVERVLQDGNKIILTMDDQYRLLDPATEVLTRAAIVRNLTQIPGIEYVSIDILEEPLTDRSGNPIGPMEASMFIDNEGKEINAYEKTKLKLYFANEAGDRLVAATRTVVYNTNISLEKLVVEQLIKGPNSTEIFPTINPETKINNVTVKDGTCYVNLNESFLVQTSAASTEVTIYSIVNSLVELPNVNRVQILLDGETDVSFRESVPLSTVFERNYDIVTAQG